MIATGKAPPMSSPTHPIHARVHPDGLSIEHGWNLLRRIGPIEEARESTPIGGSPGIERSPSVGFVGTFPPTQCGIATFTAALLKSMSRPGFAHRLGVVEVVGADTENCPLAAPVMAQWHQNDELSLRRAANILNGFDSVIVQHEYGIYGGPDGAEIVALLDRLLVPTVVVLHTVVASPSPNQRHILEAVVRASSRSVVMTEAARTRLLDVYDVDPAKITVIPHGAHASAMPPAKGPGHRPVVLTWGLLGPGKGIEAAIDAMAEIRDLVPTPRYIIAGETHPKVLAACGQEYRHRLMARADRVGVNHIVEFDDSYRNLESLAALIASAEVVVLPYESRDQVTSGVLIEAVAAGKPVVATAFPHAVELLSSGAGLVVPHGEPARMGVGIRSILTNPNIGSLMCAEARRIAPDLLWPSVGDRFTELLASIARPIAGARSN
jgi:polysaccharide biosynthesis protein PslF